MYLCHLRQSSQLASQLSTTLLVLLAVTGFFNPATAGLGNYDCCYVVMCWTSCIMSILLFRLYPVELHVTPLPCVQVPVAHASPAACHCQVLPGASLPAQHQPPTCCHPGTPPPPSPPPRPRCSSLGSALCTLHMNNKDTRCHAMPPCSPRCFALTESLPDARKGPLEMSPPKPPFLLFPVLEPQKRLQTKEGTAHEHNAVCFSVVKAAILQ